MNRIKVFSALAVALFTVFAAEARTVSITASEQFGKVKLLFGAADSQNTLYLHAAYGTTDGGSTIGGWENVVYVADIAADTMEYECALPAGWGTSVKAVRYFLTTGCADYAFSYEYIRFKGAAGNGAYFVTDYTPKPAQTHVVCDYTPKENRNMAVFCSRGGNPAKSFTQFFLTSNFRFDCGTSGTASHQATISKAYNNRYLVESGPELTVISDNGATTNTASCTDGTHTNFTAPTVLYLFASHNGGGTVDNCANAEVRFLRIYESDAGVYDQSTLVHDYIPVLNPATGKGALYDKVTRTFLAHTRSGSETYDCEYVNPIPVTYESTGCSDTLGYAARTLSVVSATPENAATKATLAVSAGNLVGELIVVALGDYDYGAEPSAWPTNVMLTSVTPAAQQLTVTLPSCWGTKEYAAARFFIVHAHPTPLEVVGSVKGNGGANGAYIDLGRKGVFGDMVQVIARGSGQGLIFGARDSATENCFVVKFVQGDIFLDYSDYTISRGNYTHIGASDWITCLNTPTERRAYDGVGTSGAIRGNGSMWNDNQHYQDAVTKDFTTSENLLLFSVNGDNSTTPFDNSIKSCCLWHTDGTTTNLVMDLVPIRNGRTHAVGFYDRVSKTEFYNAAGKGSFTAEGAVQEVIDSVSDVVAESVAQTASLPIFASQVRARPGENGTVNIAVKAPEGQTWHVYAVYADEDKGPDPAAWGTNVVVIADGTGTGNGNVVWTQPQAVRRKKVRFFLSSAAPLQTYEYLASDGTAYIDLGRPGYLGDIVSFKFFFFNGTAASRLFGARNADATVNNFSIQGSASFFVDYSDYSVSRLTSTLTGNFADYWFEVISSPNLRQLWQDGVSKGSDTREVTKNFVTDNNLRLFDVGGWSGGCNFGGRIKDFELKHVENGVTNDVMRLVPVYLAETEKYCMFDEVRMQFLGNAANSGSFSSDEEAKRDLRAYPSYRSIGASSLLSGNSGFVMFIR